MPYQVTRNGQTYGPYTLDDLQRYVTSGNVLPSDLAKSEDMPDWVPVSQILSIPIPAPTLSPSVASYPASTIPYPDPPNLHWGLVLLFGFLTCGIFTFVWVVAQSLWLKKVEPASKIMTYCFAYIALEVLNLGGSVGKIALIMHGRPPAFNGPTVAFSLITACISIAAFVMFIVYRFTMRSELERHFNGPEPVGLRLSGVMTFFFGEIYFQYHFNRINEMKQAMRFRGASI